MAAAATPETSNNSQPVRLPPEEKFWQRYSRHQEMPISALGSFLLHSLVIGGLVVLVLLGWLGFSERKGSLPVEAVRFVGGGGGKPGGVGKAPGVGQAPEAAQPDTKPDQHEQPLPPDPARPRLDVNAVTAAAPEVVKSDPVFKRYVQEGNENLKIFEKVNASALGKMRDGLAPGKGQGGPGSGNGRGSGEGTGDGDGRGPGQKGALSQREKRMLRWTMVFDTRTGADYVNQRRSLGAILAIPESDGKSYKIIRDLAGPRPAKLLDEDVSQINRIFWIDDRPESIQSVMATLGLSKRPGHFVAFMPEGLEEELFKIELAYRGRTEDQVHSTKFRVVPDARRGFKPVVSEQTGR